jgi:hypothetical protein
VTSSPNKRCVDTHSAETYSDSKLSPLTEDHFHSLAEEYLHDVLAELEDVVERSQNNDFDVDYSVRLVVNLLRCIFELKRVFDRVEY